MHPYVRFNEFSAAEGTIFTLSLLDTLLHSVGGWAERPSPTVHANICSGGTSDNEDKTVFEHFKDIELRTMSNR